MAALILKMSVSLDGFVAPKDGSSGWIAAGRSRDALHWNVETASNAGAHLMGATTYAAIAGHWPNNDGPFAKPTNFLSPLSITPVSTTAFSGGVVADVFTPFA